jgi:hypothetical protein
MEFGCFIFGGPDWAAEAGIVGTHRTKFSAPVTVILRCDVSRRAPRLTIESTVRQCAAAKTDRLHLKWQTTIYWVDIL